MGKNTSLFLLQSTINLDNIIRKRKNIKISEKMKINCTDLDWTIGTFGFKRFDVRFGFNFFLNSVSSWYFET